MWGPALWGGVELLLSGVGYVVLLEWWVEGLDLRCGTKSKVGLMYRVQWDGA